MLMSVLLYCYFKQLWNCHAMPLWELAEAEKQSNCSVNHFCGAMSVRLTLSSCEIAVPPCCSHIPTRCGCRWFTIASNCGLLWSSKDRPGGWVSFWSCLGACLFAVFLLDFVLFPKAAMATRTADVTEKRQIRAVKCLLQLAVLIRD